MHSLRLPRLLIFTVLYFLACRQALYATSGDTTFTFTLDGTYTTSAGVYKPDGTLVRTLWRKVAYGSGSTTRTWDNRDDDGNPVPAGNYAIRLLYHNTQYLFDGMVGNTSSPSFGTSVFHGMQGIHNLAITGNSAFFANGIDEGRQTMHYFDTNNRGQQIDIGHKDSYVGFDQVAADENKVYFACGQHGFIADWPPANLPGGDPLGDGYHTFVVAFSTTVSPLSAVFDAIPFPTPAGINLNTNLPPGTTNSNDHDTYWVGVIDVDQDYWPYDHGANYKAPTGIAVQRAGQGNGNVLAVAHGGLNVVRLFDKNSGTLLRTISVSNPQGLAMSPDGSLWVITGQTVQKYSGPYLTQQGGKGNPTAGPTASDDLDLPVAIAVSPAGLLIVADSGTHQQIKFFNSNGVAIPEWTYGQRGGYSTNGPDIALDKFGFQVNRGSIINHTPLALQADGSLWIGDGASQWLRATYGYSTGNFWPNGFIMYFGGNGTSTVDAHDPKRVIGDGFLEFEVNYNAPIGQGWALKKNWAAGLPSKYLYDLGGHSGLRSVRTFKIGQEYGQVTGNGRTYGLLTDFTDGHQEIVELPASGPLRLTGIPIVRKDLNPGIGDGNPNEVSWESDGSLRYHAIVGDWVYWGQAQMNGFLSNGDPIWEWPMQTTPAYASATNLDPIAGFGQNRYPITSSNVLVAFDPSSINWSIPPGSGVRVDHVGWHLGGLSLTPGNNHHWLWKVSPTNVDTDIDGLGSFLVEHANGTTVPYSGTTVVAAGRNIVYGYHEEGYHDGGNASQWMHFYDDGLFVGQFGTPYDPRYEGTGAGAVPGSTALMYFPSMVMVDANNNEAAPGTGETYIWTNTLSSHSGVPRWHIAGANQIQEMTGTVSPGGTVSLNNPTPPTFPTGLKAVPGNGQVALSWVNAPPPSSAYVLTASTTSFGPAVQSYSNNTGTTHTFTGLTNDSSASSPAPYYFRIGGGSGTPSNEVLAYPFDRLGRCGQLVGGPAYPWQVSSVAQMTDSPSLSGISSVVGNLARTSVGSKGYAIYGWQMKEGNRVDNIKTIAGYQINLGSSGWVTWPLAAHFRFDVDGVQGSLSAVHANTTGDVSITVPTGDSSVHYLTVFCPALNDPDLANHKFTLTLASQSVPAPPPAVYSNNGLGNYNRIYQFEFTGNVTLTISRLAPDFRMGLQAIFVD